METIHNREAWNKGKLVGQKPPLKPKDIWAIRIYLQNAQPFKNELVMLIRSVRRHPQAGLEDVKTKHPTALRCCAERGMVN